MVNSILEILENEKIELLSEYNSLNFSKRNLILYSVTNTTLRAFKYKNGDYKMYTPSSIFRTWADNYVDKIYSEIDQEQDFKRLHKKAFQSLKKYWNEVDKGTPEDYKFYKLIDLFFKFLPRYTEINDENSEWIFNNANIPIDKFSLKCYRKYSQQNTLNVPKAASMNFAEKSGYDNIQNHIRNLVAPFPPLLLDLLAWKEGHNNDDDDEFILIKHNK